MTTVITYRSTDASAPVLTGQVGSLVALLHACLVAGYSGKSAAGWTSAFTATNKETYTNSAVDGTGFSLYVDDTGPGGGGARETRMTGFEVATAIGTGTGQFPTFAQLGIGIGATVCRKSTTADATARPWTIIADDTVFYLFIETGDQLSPTAAYVFVFGDIFSYKASDAYRCIIVGRNSENTSSAAAENFVGLLSCGNNMLGGTIAGHFMPRSYTGIGGSILVGKHTDLMKMGNSAGGANLGTTGTNGLNNNSNICTIGYNGNFSNFPYPNGPDGGLYLAPLWINHTNCLRGYLKGLWAPMQNAPLNHNDTFSGSGNFSGKSFVAQNTLALGTSTFTGQTMIETSSTWS